MKWIWRLIKGKHSCHQVSHYLTPLFETTQQNGIHETSEHHTRISHRNRRSPNQDTTNPLVRGPLAYNDLDSHCGAIVTRHSLSSRCLEWYNTLRLKSTDSWQHVKEQIMQQIFPLLRQNDLLEKISKGMLLSGHDAFQLVTKRAKNTLSGSAAGLTATLADQAAVLC